MTSRFNVPSVVDAIPSGYNKLASDVSIPPCGVEDVDVGLFNLFDKEIKISVGNDQVQTKKVPIVFATGERWAMLKRNEPLRDSTNTLILPLIAITRSGLAQGAAEDVVGRGIAPATGEFIIKRKLGSTDRGYQALVNRLLLKNQLNVAVPDADKITDQVSTERSIGDMASDIDVIDGAYLKSNRLNNVYEVISIPTPQYFTATYDVLFRAQYTEQMNQMIEIFMSSMLPWGQCWRIDTKKGYWFVATLAEGTFTNETNFQKVEGERIINWKVSLKVPGYVLASNAPGVPVPVRRYISAPIISFAASGPDPSIEVSSGEDVSTPYLGSDDPTLPLDASNRTMRRTDMRQTNAALQYAPIRTDEPCAADPALTTFSRGRKPGRFMAQKFVGADGRQYVKYVPVQSTNPSSGETVYTGDFDGIVISVED